MYTNFRSYNFYQLRVTRYSCTMTARGLRDARVAPLNRTRGRSPSVLLNGATSASRKPQALRHRTNGLYDASVCGQPDRLYLVRAHPSEKARKKAPARRRPLCCCCFCNHPESASGRATSSGSSFWMDQSSPVVDPVLLSSVDVTRPVLRRF